MEYNPDRIDFEKGLIAGIQGMFGDKETAKQLWAEEDLLVARIDILMAEELAAQPKTDIFADFFEANKDFLAN